MEQIFLGFQDPIFLHLDVPCLCLYADLCKQPEAFLELPEQYGLHWNTAHHPELTGLDQDSAGPFLQGWLFFGLLAKISALFGVGFQPRDFVSSSPNGVTLVSGAGLRKYAWLWCAANSTLHADGTEQRMVRVRAYLDILHKVTNAWIGYDGVIVKRPLERIILSLVLLGEVLTFALPQLLRDNDIIFPGYYTWSLPVSLRRDLRQAGWCRGELPSLQERFAPPRLVYLSSVNRQRQDKDHSRCTDDACVANQLEEERYVVRHAPNCETKEADFVHAPVEAMCYILKASGIPMVRVVAGSSSGIPTIEITAFVLGHEQRMPAYVAISHVWSDGMGNPTHNALPACHLLRIQRHVDGLNTCDPAGSGPG